MLMLRDTMKFNPGSMATISSLTYIVVVSTQIVHAASTTTIECYTCTSNADSYCMDNPSTLTRCPISHGKGCATKISLSGVMERGCSDIGIAPQGCQVSSFFGTECVCHSDRCNNDIPTTQPNLLYMSGRTISCYNCDSTFHSDCSYDIIPQNIDSKTCPKQNGCYLTKRVNSDDGTMLYNRLCYEGDGPATYYPAGCYTVFNEQTSSTIEVCVCYTDSCNKNMKTALDSIETIRAQARESNSGLLLSSYNLLISTILLTGLLLAGYH